MPFSALSPDGPVSLLGADAATVERMRSRNRQEGCFTAKCCGAPVIVRTAQGKTPHFVHKVVPTGCDGERRETPEHRRLKEVIAKEAADTYEWDVETEAIHRDPLTQSVLWRADVLACRRKVAVAFEVQLSHADFEEMGRRQKRYKDAGVRGLWFVRTKKGFPVSQELPIFPIDSERSGDWVGLATAWDRPEIWMYADGAEYIELTDFVRAALDGQLKWAPFDNAPETQLRGYVDFDELGTCAGCNRTVVQHRCVRARIANLDSYPQFIFAGARDYGCRSEWYMPLVNAVWNSVREGVDKTFRSNRGRCCWCSAPLTSMRPGALCKRGWLAASLQLKDLPKPRFGSVERDWLRRWSVLDQ